eukprot:1859746-Rhodomonas_salina.2
MLSLRGPYAVSGKDIRCLRTRCAVPHVGDTDMRLLRDVRYWRRLYCDAVGNSTAIYGITERRCPVLTWAMLLPGGAGAGPFETQRATRMARARYHRSAGLSSYGPCALASYCVMVSAYARATPCPASGVVVSAYAAAMRRPVLSWRMGLPGDRGEEGRESK